MNAQRTVFSLSGALLASMAIFALKSATAIFAAEPNHEGAKLPTFQTAKVARGDLVLHVRASGTIEPDEVVDVGAQVAGLIAAFGPDAGGAGATIDFNSKVKKGQVLAEIDDRLYRAQLDAAQASLLHAEADRAVAQAKLEMAVAESKRTLELLKSMVIPQFDLDIAKATEVAAKAGVDLAAAEIVQAKAAVEMAQLNLEYTKIKSPIDGVVIDRRVNVGQIVVADLNAPSLFLIAHDLKRLLIRAEINESEIGQIQVGQSAECRVAAFPERSLQGKVAQIRLNAQKTQNVVTYTVVVSIDNADGKLLPYMTAGMTIEVGRLSGVLMVPNEALRWLPQPEWIAPDAREKGAVSPTAHLRLEGRNSNAGPRRVWIRDGQFVRPIEVQLGPTEGSMTEIRSGDLKEGQEVVVKAS